MAQKRLFIRERDGRVRSFDWSEKEAKEFGYIPYEEPESPEQSEEEKLKEQKAIEEKEKKEAEIKASREAAEEKEKLVKIRREQILPFESLLSGPVDLGSMTQEEFDEFFEKLKKSQAEKEEAEKELALKAETEAKERLKESREKKLAAYDKELYKDVDLAEISDKEFDDLEARLKKHQEEKKPAAKPVAQRVTKTNKPAAQAKKTTTRKRVK